MTARGVPWAIDLASTAGRLADRGWKVDHLGNRLMVSRNDGRGQFAFVLGGDGSSRWLGKLIDFEIGTWLVRVRRMVALDRDDG